MSRTIKDMPGYVSLFNNEDVSNMTFSNWSELQKYLAKKDKTKRTKTRNRRRNCKQIKSNLNKSTSKI